MKPAIVKPDSHQLFFRSLGRLINRLDHSEVVSESMNSKDIISKMGSMKGQPDLLLIEMQKRLKGHRAMSENSAAKNTDIKMVALSSNDDHATIINMMRAGCWTYLLKDINPDEFEKALQEIEDKPFHKTNASNVSYRLLTKKSKKDNEVSITAREKVFLELACSDLTYRQIAEKMHLSERTIDGYRESLFGKMNVLSRVGMAMEAVRRGMVRI
ncbi:MAG: response regulator transcription factor [Ferruginibacter sp.]